MKRRNFIISFGALAGLFANCKAKPKNQLKQKCLFGDIQQQSKSLVVLPQGNEAVCASELKIHILGACSGTWPEPNAKHTALIIQESDGTPLWFDAGEFSSWTAYLMGIDFTKLKNIFISHPHIDHTGGLSGLFATFQHGYHKKNIYTQEARAKELTLNIFSASEKVVDSAYSMYWESNRGYRNFHVNRKPIDNGIIFKDNEVSVEALANRHMGNDKDGNPLSYSFRVLLKNGKNIIFSGDVRNLDDMKPWLDEGCALLMMETGHHRAMTICNKLKKTYPKVNDVLFLHHGVDVLRDPFGEKDKAEKAWGAPIIFAEDAMSVSFI